MVRVSPVSTFLMVTATSGRVAPAWFVTTPERLAPVWAHAGNAAIVNNTPVVRNKDSEQRKQQSLREIMGNISFFSAMTD
jgi:hypothetical protein